ncbi:hypothetical protein A3C98_01870 [Candidatus Roizmanbacteria bacterium RIFCSPHIGHO2_02_FULL_37_15]|uniref:FAD-binding FR-type domain-containing protein n=1 Tax=Candidatus Roizmanbacteria bacterium RIFCSPLOWO2_01_FULL_37_16 TaxID=1802058 RepID=A0A1F7IPN1_9BACT|nr:MAG: hypothetical protein A2859_01935 [Candidatus Roizmanbacteria bacterium RIFCSPHIGHO2_01_FULL_37_16b]OGK22148.1 MAG: hypothetical protein A3C98_01870 [Candidatus Roizmanbacteria bacterium RIFCSPHIGHO2_02_FULL_37_15]OGK34112.1 MAG: hypothetical protein A3F57_06735 [Candidatus Roizmanbacteria bacterium RIFCSPHIGHO2_12_FULL_36_11]OGK45319.1 MAG: hypothetical protein A3B40_05495 [Candidatus Roizmanbacteria bacterium RIFCSPLOWO2_01_FULL_37_16]OGK57128.1 MAG: hypothetical protein A3I50_02065 [C
MIEVAQKFDIKYFRKDQLTKDTYSLFFQRPPQLDFLPGQFMRLTLNIDNPDERGNSRFFSIASSPSEKDYLMITTRTDHSTFKKSLFSLPDGAKVQLSAPYGTFTLKKEEAAPHVFLAGGIGITPFRSMIRYASDSGLSIPITLFSSFSEVGDVIFQKEFQEIAAKHSWLKLVETITQPGETKSSWQGNIGRIDADLIKKHVSDLSSSLFYSAGPPSMVEAIVNIVKSLGVNDSRIRKEKFSGY